MVDVLYTMSVFKKYFKCLYCCESENERNRRYYNEISVLIDKEYPYMSIQDRFMYKSQLYDRKLLLKDYNIS